MVSSTNLDNLLLHAKVKEHAPILADHEEDRLVEDNVRPSVGEDYVGEGVERLGGGQVELQGGQIDEDKLRLGASASHPGPSARSAWGSGGSTLKEERGAKATHEATHEKRMVAAVVWVILERKLRRRNKVRAQSFRRNARFFVGTRSLCSLGRIVIRLIMLKK